MGERLSRAWARAFHSVRGRVTMVMMAISAAGLIFTLGVVLVLVRERAQMNAAREASHLARPLATSVVTERPPDPIPFPRHSTRSFLVQIVADDGTVLNGSARLRDIPPISRVQPEGADVRVDTTACPKSVGKCVYIVGFRAPQTAYDQPVTVYAAVELPSVLLTDEISAETMSAVALALALVLVIGLATWWGVGSTLRPVDEITEELASITASDLSRRVPVHYSGGGEMQRLAETINGTLERLEHATERQRRFVAEASHDLRNPIAGLLTRLEVLDSEDDDYPWKTAVHEAVSDVERLSAIVEDLLELARLEAGAAPPSELIDLGEFVTKEIGQRMPDRLEITTDLGSGLWVRCSPLRLGRVLENLLANAERHGRSEVRVSVAEEDGRAVLLVRDDGDGVPPEHRERIFERFARLKESRERDTGGTGLGLPIAREIAHNYGGTLTVEDGPGGRFALRLPLTDPPKPGEEYWSPS
ncbi:HAMP domain-containing histidine kinase [Actinocorallia sp. API 0066]|uniref:sensor histidine kinase n=1 Tax=Actinocorallia sp. API 0066 TaxID=2896846 RepID=UPI001E3C8E71|nr:HAMP domain-containing sensor histidine kinase [Actinocorallia sp. API 0066]MCD0450296.1 HAMP domain-containing histidine kinase [Actinocorallia sp. API 0066]